MKILIFVYYLAQDNKLSVYDYFIYKDIKSVPEFANEDIKHFYSIYKLLSENPQ